MHAQITGQSRTGKSTLMEQLILKDIEAGFGVCVFDPHGPLIDAILSHYPRHRTDDLIIFDPSDAKHPIAWNPFHQQPAESRPLFARALTTTVHDIWDYGRTPTPDIDLAVYNGARALMDTPDGTLLGLFRMITDMSYRETVIAHSKDPIVKAYYQYFNTYSEKDKKDKERSTLNKIEMLLADPYVRNVIGQVQSSFTLQDVLYKGQCLLVRLQQGTLGVEGTKAIGSLLLTSLHHEALRRTESTHFGVFIDEVHTFGKHTLCEMLSGVGKYGVDVTIAHQYYSQLTEELKDAVLGNVTTRYVFRTSPKDSTEILDTIEQNNNKTDPCDLPRFTARVLTEEPQDDITVEPLPVGKPYKDLLRHSRATYGRRRDHVEERILKFFDSTG